MDDIIIKTANNLADIAEKSAYNSKISAYEDIRRSKISVCEDIRRIVLSYEGHPADFTIPEILKQLDILEGKNNA